MEIHFRLKALNAEGFKAFFTGSDSELEKSGAKRIIIDSCPGYPCRISLKDLEPGEEALLMPYLHHDVHSPYRASGPIFVGKNAETANMAVNEIPLMLQHRLLSIRGYTSTGMMKNASVVEGKTLKDELIRFFKNKEITYIHIHNARQGCYLCLAEREND
ncbi:MULTISPECIES: DUF1203 domain-containing protein [Chryseobacterium]|uniref:DUF1203 domain-containing protein n=1 Tax=Chryseobacterium camelliae TaxID=1265445 RepID=A0ABU0TG19_9FLAO|nr:MULTISPECIES: DUF1203 domain-containing protein [Chryseobacterium]MDT3406190.1 hypothetical protein [Pseudacidovorax intermedius]MDQ1096009.1 hypothetical protein [Chryseobacterium camelliae]MDQ1099945.1 hypothetical protein [Chryseobacterium sp. SORGH_AS_1048]MDR6087290.1 hypothetical protein [Chryseobacterium sp. SORGH_AS_0909]MDR6131665.1 hypothetical protein [Chryseobacterium sp. SORGH_AS_1175]